MKERARRKHAGDRGREHRRRDLPPPARGRSDERDTCDERQEEGVLVENTAKERDPLSVPATNRNSGLDRSGRRGAI
jgi:hypothetical protein